MPFATRRARGEPRAATLRGAAESVAESAPARHRPGGASSTARDLPREGAATCVPPPGRARPRGARGGAGPGPPRGAAGRAAARPIPARSPRGPIAEAPALADGSRGGGGRAVPLARPLPGVRRPRLGPHRAGGLRCSLRRAAGAAGRSRGHLPAPRQRPRRGHHLPGVRPRLPRRHAAAARWQRAGRRGHGGGRGVSGLGRRGAGTALEGLRGAAG